MNKIPTMFERDWKGDRSRVLDIPNPACEWVFAGEGVATRKIDGSCCMVRDGKLYKRRELREGDKEPAGFERVTRDDETSKIIGWVPVGDGPDDQWHRWAFANVHIGDLPPVNGSYELVGPKCQGNPERYLSHVLISHSATDHFHDVPRDFDGLREWLTGRDIEGIVFHHPDGRMAKIKLKDFGLRRQLAPAESDPA